MMTQFMLVEDGVQLTKRPMSSRDADSGIHSVSHSPRVVAIVAKNEVIELWHIHLQRTDYRERDIEVSKEMRVRLVDGRRQRREVHQRQIERQPWGRFIIHRYQATRMLPWTPSLGLAMLIPGTLLAAGSARGDHAGSIQPAGYSGGFDQPRRLDGIKFRLANHIEPAAVQ
jgi:hypothetical protein